MDAGGLLTYTLTVVNSGVVSATGVLITDTIPANTTFITATLPHSGPDANDVLTWALGTLDIGAPRTVTMTVQVDDPLPDGTLLTNTAWVTSTEGITDTDTVTTEVESAHTLAITKTAAPSPVQAGGLLTYTLEWSVSGNETALGVTISDTVPLSTTYQGCEGGNDCDESSGVITWTLGNRDPGANGTVTFTVLVDSPLPDGTIIENAALITDTQGITDTDEITTEVESSHTLEVVKSVTPTVVAPDGLITYTIAYTIAGNEPAYNVTLSDTTPAHTTFYTATPTASNDPGVGNAGLVTWDLGNQNPPASGNVTLVVRADSPLTDGLAITNTVRITDTSGETDEDTAETIVESAHSLAITKTASPTPVQAGARLTYTLAWSVDGDETALGVTLSDTVPANTAFEACTGCDQSGALLTWDLGDVVPYAAGTVTFTVNVDSPLPDGTLIENAALISDTQGITDTDDVTTPVASAHTLALTKTAEPAVVRAGDLLTYTLDWSVDGNEPALGVTISDTVPTSTTFDSCAPLADCSHSNGIVTWSLGDVNPPDAGNATLVVRVDSDVPTGTLLSNAALISDTQGLTDTDEIDTPVEAERRDLGREDWQPSR